MSNLAQVLEGTTREFGDRTAIIHAGSRMTYRELNAAANRVANLLVGRGIRPGDKVALSCPNTPYFSLVYYGILKAGATVVPLNVLLKPNEIAYHLVDSDSRAYFAFCGDAALPLGDQARAAFEQVDSCTELFLMGGTDGSAADGGEDSTRCLPRSQRSSRQRSDPTTIPPSSCTPRERRGSPRALSCDTGTCATTLWSARSCSGRTHSGRTSTCAPCRCSTPSDRRWSRTPASRSAARWS